MIHSVITRCDIPLDGSASSGSGALGPGRGTSSPRRRAHRAGMGVFPVKEVPYRLALRKRAR